MINLLSVILDGKHLSIISLYHLYFLQQNKLFNLFTIYEATISLLNQFIGINVIYFKLLFY